MNLKMTGNKLENVDTLINIAGVEIKGCPKCGSQNMDMRIIANVVTCKCTACGHAFAPTKD